MDEQGTRRRQRRELHVPRVPLAAAATAISFLPPAAGFSKRTHFKEDLFCEQSDSIKVHMRWLTAGSSTRHGREFFLCDPPRATDSLAKAVTESDGRWALRLLFRMAWPQGEHAAPAPEALPLNRLLQTLPFSLPLTIHDSSVWCLGGRSQNQAQGTRSLSLLRITPQAIIQRLHIASIRAFLRLGALDILFITSMPSEVRRPSSICALEKSVLGNFSAGAKISRNLLSDQLEGSS